MPDRPVPVWVDVQAAEQRLVALEQLLQGAHQQALAEAAGTGEEVEIALLDHTPDQGGLVDVVAAPVPKAAECLDPYRQGTAFCLCSCIHDPPMLAWRHGCGFTFGRKHAGTLFLTRKPCRRKQAGSDRLLPAIRQNYW